MSKNNCKYTSIGGQALIEGIMMKSSKRSALAVRIPDGSIDITYMDNKPLNQKNAFFKLPLVRGVVGFIDSITTGYKAMMISADKSGFADEVNEETGETQTLSGRAWAAIMAVASVLAVVLSVALFMYLPRLAVQGLEWLTKTHFSAIARSSIEQALKLLVFLAYIFAVSYMKDIHRVFQYHGAEHKTIFCYEAKLPLTVENVRKQKRFHPRCGTSFMILMILISVVVSTVVQILFKGVYENAIIWTLIKLLMIPLICGLGYEVLKLCGRYDNVITRIISAPGVWVQRITTKEPDDSMIEVAIAAMNEVIPENFNKTEEIKEEQAEENDNI